MNIVFHNTNSTLKTKYHIGGYEKETDEKGGIAETHYTPYVGASFKLVPPFKASTQIIITQFKIHFKKK